ncbi:hypothetical protein CYMTET_31304, partial [Cymbomonas tetramitiformis]
MPLAAGNDIFFQTEVTLPLVPEARRPEADWTPSRIGEEGFPLPQLTPSRQQPPTSPSSAEAATESTKLSPDSSPKISRVKVTQPFSPAGSSYKGSLTSSQRGRHKSRVPSEPQARPPPGCCPTPGSVLQHSVAVQAAPCPWMRYYFSAGRADGGDNAFLKHFDVWCTGSTLDRAKFELDYPGDMAMVAPAWLRNSWKRLYCAALPDNPKLMPRLSNDVEWRQ